MNKEQWIRKTNYIITKKEESLPNTGSDSDTITNNLSIYKDLFSFESIFLHNKLHIDANLLYPILFTVTLLTWYHSFILVSFLFFLFQFLFSYTRLSSNFRQYWRARHFSVTNFDSYSHKFQSCSL